MKRTLAAVLAALLTWVVVASVLNIVLRHGMAGYVAAEPTFSFTLGMQLARLALAAIASLTAGAVAAWIAANEPRAPWIAGVILLLVFLPTHVRLWHSFPLWYHMTFLVTLVPLVLLGARWVRARPTATAPAAS
jgi:hypothetical protein